MRMCGEGTLLLGGLDTHGFRFILARLCSTVLHLRVCRVLVVVSERLVCFTPGRDIMGS